MILTDRGIPVVDRGQYNGCDVCTNACPEGLITGRSGEYL